MAPKSQLCACSFQDSLRQKNWALEQISKFPDTIGYMWTAENDSNTLRVDAKIFAAAKKYLRKKKFPDTCGHGLKHGLGIKRGRRTMYIGKNERNGKRACIKQ